MRLIALDVGLKRIGVAFCDTSVGIVFPRKPIIVESEDKAIEEIKNIVVREKIDRVVVGLPMNFNSSRSKIQEYIEEFSSKLKERLGVRVELFDERFTTRIAENLGIGKKNIDSVSASILLEDYVRLLAHKPESELEA